MNKIFDNDLIIKILDIINYIEYSPIYQRKMEEVKISKFVYKEHNGVFMNKHQVQRPKQKCVFDLHTNRKSSYVTIYDRNNEVIFNGNSLWSVGSHKTKDEHIKFIARLHSTEQVINLYSA